MVSINFQIPKIHACQIQMLEPRCCGLSLTLHEAASEFYLKWQGGGIQCTPYKNQFRAHFNQNFSHNLTWGTKITLENLGF